MIEEQPSPLDFGVLILDATMWSFVDWTAAREILQIIDRLQELGVTILFAGLSGNANVINEFLVSVLSLLRRLLVSL